MTATSNIFGNPPPVPADVVDDLMIRQSNGIEKYYCERHLKSLVDARSYRNFSVGSTQRFLAIQKCYICGETAQFIVAD